MSKFKVTFPSGATPIEPDGLKDLIPDYISTMSELNQAEQSNIADGFVWAEKQIQEDLELVLASSSIESYISAEFLDDSPHRIQL